MTTRQDLDSNKFVFLRFIQIFHSAPGARLEDHNFLRSFVGSFGHLPPRGIIEGGGGGGGGGGGEGGEGKKRREVEGRLVGKVEGVEEERAERAER